MASPAQSAAGGSSKATGDHPSRLTLHIPNAYPRATTPSPRQTPVLGSSSPLSTLSLDDAAAEGRRNANGRDSPLRAGSPLDANATERQGQLKKSKTTSNLPERAKYVRSSPHLPLPVSTMVPRSPQEGPGTVADERRSVALSARKAAHKVRLFFRVQMTSGESARDFLARERTFFSWLRLSTMLAIGSAALFLRLRIKDLSTVFKPHSGARVATTSREEAVRIALRRKLVRHTLRRRQQKVFQASNSENSSFYPILSQAIAPTATPTYPVAQLISTPTPLAKSHVGHSILETNIVLSQALGAAFFALAIVALAVGYLDYVRCERALEQADQLVDLPPQATADRSRDDEHPTNVERRAAANAAKVWHDGRFAKMARSSLVVHVTEVVIALMIFATALIILITSNQASIAPVSMK